MGSGCSSNKDKVEEEQLDEHDYLAGFANDFTEVVPSEGDPKKQIEVSKGEYFQQVKITDTFSVLVASVNEDGKRGGKIKYVGIGSKCPHYGADLGKGVMKDGKIYCPWHGACFDFETGDIEEFPGLDNLPSYPCKIKNQKVFVRVEPDRIQNKVMRPLGKKRNDDLIFAIVGSGAAGYMCAQTLRQEGFDGRLLFITTDKVAPYDRPKLSKAPGSSWDDIKLRGRNFYADNDIDLYLDSYVETIDLKNHRIYCHRRDGYFPYDQLFLATGQSPRLFNDMPSQHLHHIVTLHNIRESEWIGTKAVGKRMLICGSSFIAMELATSMRDKCKSITIISRSDAPFSHVFGFTAGKRLLKHLLHKAPNVTFIGPDEVVEFEGDDKGYVIGARTKLKRHIECDVVVLALGSYADTSYIYENPFKIHKHTGAIKVDKYLRTINCANTYAGGDCCTFPLFHGAKKTASIGHWQVALQHGRVAALNMLGHEVRVDTIIPFFWTTVCGVNIRYCGYGESFDEVLVFGSLEKLECCVLYRRGGRILAAMGIGCDPLITAIAVELQTETIWYQDIEFPECLTNRFPDPPQLVEERFDNVPAIFSPPDISEFHVRGLFFKKRKRRAMKRLDHLEPEKPRVWLRRRWGRWDFANQRFFEKLKKARAKWYIPRHEIIKMKKRAPWIKDFVKIEQELQEEKKRKHSALKKLKREIEFAKIEAQFATFKPFVNRYGRDGDLIPKHPRPLPSTSSSSGRSDYYHSSCTSTSTESVHSSEDELAFVDLPKKLAAELKYRACIASAKRWLEFNFNPRAAIPLLKLPRKHKVRIIEIYKKLYPTNPKKKLIQNRWLRFRHRERKLKTIQVNRWKESRRQERLQKLPIRLV